VSEVEVNEQASKSKEEKMNTARVANDNCVHLTHSLAARVACYISSSSSNQQPASWIKETVFKTIVVIISILFYWSLLAC
jgi:hypothetical protein